MKRYKIISCIVALIVLFFLIRGIAGNWRGILKYEFSLDYFYLILSLPFFLSNLVLQGLIWNVILRLLDPGRKMPFFEGFRIFVYSWFGRYLPGKAWACVGRVCLGTRKGVDKKILTMSVIYESVLSIVSAFLLSLAVLSASVGALLFESINLVLPFFIISAGLLFIHPRFFRWLFNLVARKLGSAEVSPSIFLKYSVMIRIVLYYFVAFTLAGSGFFFLVRSVVVLPSSAMIEMIGIFVLASVLGVIAIFAPSGLGVREGVLIVFLQLHMSLGTAILISFLARLWATASELVLLAVVWLCAKLKKKNYE